MRETPSRRRGLNAREAADYIGFAPATFTKRVKSGELPQPDVIAGVPRWDRKKLDALFGDNVPSAEGGDWDEVLR